MIDERSRKSKPSIKAPNPRTRPVFQSHPETLPDRFAAAVLNMRMGDYIEDKSFTKLVVRRSFPNAQAVASRAENTMNKSVLTLVLAFSLWLDPDRQFGPIVPMQTTRLGPPFFRAHDTENEGPRCEDQCHRPQT